MKAILTFHSIDDSRAILSYPVNVFRDLVESLHKNSVPVITLDQMHDGMDGVVLSFDDGMASVYSHALPVLRDAGFPAHLFLTTGAVGGDNRWPTQPAAAQEYPMLDWQQLEACVEGGMLIDGHTHTHPYLTQCSDAQIADECHRSNALIEERFGRRPNAFAYPYGNYDARVKEAIRPIYACAVTTALDYVGTNPEPLSLPRLDTYYLQRPLTYRALSALPTRIYIGLRRVLRHVRGSR